MKRGFSKELIASFLSIRIVKNQFPDSRNLAQRQTASAYLQDLAGIGILEPLKIGRKIYYINTVLMQILSASEGERVMFLCTLLQGEFKRVFENSKMQGFYPHPSLLPEGEGEGKFA